MHCAHASQPSPPAKNVRKSTTDTEGGTTTTFCLSISAPFPTQPPLANHVCFAVLNVSIYVQQMRQDKQYEILRKEMLAHKCECKMNA